MEPIEEFNEAELFDGNQSDCESHSDSEEVDCVEAEPPAGAGRADDHGESSAKSSMTMTALDATSELPQEDMPNADQLPTLRTVAASMPAMTGHIRMGSSVPVSIPHMGRWKKAEAAPDSPNTQYAPATFVPPHQLSQVNDFMFSFTGDSPSVAIKRERLRVRNAILASTGFLEPGAEQNNLPIGLLERNRPAVTAGGLSQALQPRSSATAAAAPVESS